MTKDTHIQIITECVTPNVPKIRTSFFNRKFRDKTGGSDGLQSTPTTPKVSTNRARNSSSSSRSRSRRSGGSSRTKANVPNNGRPPRSRPQNNEFYDQDFSTPRAARSLLTPPKTTTKINRYGKITHQKWQPLELDNESSSESHTLVHKKRKLSPEISNLEVLTDVCHATALPDISFQESPLAITHPETPPDTSHSETPPNEKFETFIPGNLNIDAVLDLFGKQQEPRTTKSKSEEKLIGTEPISLG